MASEVLTVGCWKTSMCPRAFGAALVGLAGLGVIAGCRPPSVLTPTDLDDADSNVVDMTARPPDLDSCGNRAQGADESDVDCGGRCGGCPDGRKCRRGSDCVGSVCAAGRCDSQRGGVRLAAGGYRDGFAASAIGDMNRDGRPDIVIAIGPAIWEFHILVAGNGAGFNLGPRTMIAAASGGPGPLLLADLDRNGYPEGVTMSGLDRNVWTVWNPGLGSPALVRSYPATMAEPFANGSLAAGDFDGDGDVDIAVGDCREGLVMFYNRGGGMFERAVPPFDLGGSFVAAADIDRDGIVDVLADYDGLRALVGGGKRMVKLTGPPGWENLVAADFNGDGWTDVAGIDAVALNDGKGGLFPRRPLGGVWEYARRASFAVAGDFNGDGRADLAEVAQYDPPTAEFAFGGPRGDMAFTVSVALSRPPADAHKIPGVGDLDGDGRDDLAVGVTYDRGWAPPEVRIVSLK